MKDDDDLKPQMDDATVILGLAAFMAGLFTVIYYIFFGV